MKKLFVCLFFVVALLAMTTSLVAQQTGYLVQEGDTLWALSGDLLGDPLRWGQVLSANPFLNAPGRVFKKDGRIVVLIRPGERLQGLPNLGITVEPVPFSELQQVVASEGPRYHPAVEWGLEKGGLYWPYLLALVSLLVVGLALMRRTLNADPATSRPALVQGGITTPEQATTRLQENAAHLYQIRTGQGAPLPAQRFTVLEQTPGRIWGVLMVRYGDGREVPRRLNGERAYRGRVRFPDSQEETLYFLQACGNDLRYGGISRYLPGPNFRFEEDPIQPAVPAPQPQVATVPGVSPIVQPTAEPAEVTEQDGTVSFEYRKATGNQPNMIRLKGIKAEEFTFSIGDGETILRFREARTPADDGQTQN